MVDAWVKPDEQYKVVEFTEDEADHQIKRLAMKGMGAIKELLPSGKYSVRITDWVD